MPAILDYMKKVRSTYQLPTQVDTFFLTHTPEAYEVASYRQRRGMLTIKKAEEARKVTVLIDRDMHAASQFARQTPIGVNRPHSIVARWKRG